MVAPAIAPLLPMTPYVILVDTREQKPYTFAGPFRRLRKHFTIATRTATLPTGDYSLEGFESRVAVERKSMADLFCTLGQGRARFCRELERLASFEFAAVIVEGDWQQLLLNPPERSRLDPRTVFHSVVAWSVRYPRIHWFLFPCRELAEVATARLLDQFHRTHAATSGTAPQPR